jgi:hypothetical protein
MSSSFELWLETEEGDPTQPANSPIENFCNINVTLSDGRRYALNVWTFDFLPLARYRWPYAVKAGQALAKYVHPPDLFVERLDRSTIESVVTQLLENQEMKSDWLCPPDECENEMD